MTPTTLIRLLLAGEILFYVLVGAILAGSGVSGPAIAAILVAMALAGRALVVLTTFVLSRLGGSPVPAGERAGFLGGLRLFFEEYLAFVLLFTFILPFERLFIGPDRLSARGGERLPVLLVHGYQVNRAFWRWQRTRLEEAGWVVATLNLAPAFGSIDEYADQIRTRIEEVCAATGKAQVILVGHSMGGMAARAYLRRHGTARVARLVTFGSPHVGTRLALIGLGHNARQMEPQSAWLVDLNAAGASALPAEVVTAMSRYDNFVFPQESATLPTARNIVLPPVSHIAMAFSPAVTRALRAALEPRRA